MKDFIKLTLAIIPILRDLYKSLKRAKNEREKQAVIKALRDRDLDRLRKLVLR